MAGNGRNAEPWEREQEESAKAYEAFAMYRDMGANRSLKEVAKRLGKSATIIERWSSQKKWRDRCSAWDDEQDRIIRKQQIEAIKKMRKTHATIASSMMLKAAEALQNLPLEEIKAADISRMVEVASKLERISRGDVGEVVEERDGGKSDDRVHFYLPDNGRDNGKGDEEL